MRYLGFYLGKGHYVFPLKEIVEVLPILPMRDIPQAPPYIGGLINYRGRLIPVLDLCRLATNSPCRQLLSTRLFVVRIKSSTNQERLLALMVEKALNVVEMDAEQFNQHPVTIDTTPYLRGLATQAANVTQCIDIHKILQEEIADLLYQEQ